MLFLKTSSQQSDYLSYKKLFKGALLGVFLLSGGMTSAAYAQDRDMISIQNQIEALKAQVSQLQQMPSSSGSSDRNSKGNSQNNGDPSGLLPELLTRVNNLEDQQRIMRGQLDDLTNQVQTKIDLLNKKIDDANFAAGGSGGGASTSAAAPTASVSEKPAPQATPSAGSSLKDGQQALMNKNYSEAESIAQNIIKTPQGKKSVPAHFLLAQSLAGQQRYKDASVGYFDIYKKFPDSTRAPEALLGVSITLLKNGDSAAACQALGLLNNKYPNASSRIKGAASNLHKKAKCS
ncbi:hypothetical protein [Commensalibacter papalotli (ex Botero et al. 2024)]|uniref:Coordinates peptidoglycan biosynthesis and outer membrane constriction (CpoB) (PDB:2WZ7) (PUBMED:25951518) n=1 Tax=Commensalibacter papalotli (ex Botero et al. 2024) TaxID=2972766 RepID=A0ABN8W821_9PROT|nr:hypothetical protein [Commensalibacter papalotli (ex Botero et al. 2024)]CAI3933100.1 Cell division protein CpoB [Commensalibacter papalotli (ex Botero et al. 2024)]CAI3942587.1 Cell division protein CpoB [Commensalibacter papalotli (ex Botero et al. 2024)]